jgi:hypothetical protein
MTNDQISMTNGAAFASVSGIERFIKRGERLGNGIGGVFIAGEGGHSSLPGVPG